MAFIENTSISEDHLGVLRHMLGIDSSRPTEPSRNHYAVCPGSPDDTEMREMVKLGLVKYYGKAWEYHFYQATERGTRSAIDSHKKMVRKVPKKRRVYLSWLSTKDAIPNLSFKEFLTNPKYESFRRGL